MVLPVALPAPPPGSSLDLLEQLLDRAAAGEDLGAALAAAGAAPSVLSVSGLASSGDVAASSAPELPLRDDVTVEPAAAAWPTDLHDDQPPVAGDEEPAPSAAVALGPTDLHDEPGGSSAVAASAMPLPAVAVGGDMLAALADRQPAPPALPLPADLVAVAEPAAAPRSLPAGPVVPAPPVFAADQPVPAPVAAPTQAAQVLALPSYVPGGAAAALAAAIAEQTARAAADPSYGIPVEPVVAVVPVQPPPFVPTQPPLLDPSRLRLPEQVAHEPRVSLGFRDGSTTSLRPDSDQARALEELARLMTSSG